MANVCLLCSYARTILAQVFTYIRKVLSGHSTLQISQNVYTAERMTLLELGSAAADVPTFLPIIIVKAKI